MKTNALTLHNYFSNTFRSKTKRDYVFQGKGLEMSKLKNLLTNYSPYQIMEVTNQYCDTVVFFATISDMCMKFDTLVEEYAPDPLLAKARIAMIKSSKSTRSDLRKAMYDYLDEKDAWFGSSREIEKASNQLDEIAEMVLA